MFLLIGFSHGLSEESLSIGFWNVENLFDMENDPNKNDDEFAVGGRKNVTPEIYNLKIKQSAEVLKDLNVDVIGLCEVENKKVLNDLNFAFKEKNYKIIHYDSPDSRGIDNALMFDESKIKILESKAIPNTLENGYKTRDILYVKGEYLNELIHIYINHWPSNYGGREKAIPKRKTTAKLHLDHITKIQKNNKNAEIILLGDFNEDPSEENIQFLKQHGLFSLMETMIGKPKIGTYVYRGKDHLYDQIIVNKGLQDGVNLSIVPESTEILDLPKYRQQEGNYKHFPFRFWAGNRLLGGYSDHLAIKVKIKKFDTK
jgi:predicted extracellular nuclease